MELRHDPCHSAADAISPLPGQIPGPFEFRLDFSKSIPFKKDVPAKLMRQGDAPMVLQALCASELDGGVAPVEGGMEISLEKVHAPHQPSRSDSDVGQTNMVGDRRARAQRLLGQLGIGREPIRRLKERRHSQPEPWELVRSRGGGGATASDQIANTSRPERVHCDEPDLETPHHTRDNVLDRLATRGTVAVIPGDPGRGLGPIPTPCAPQC
jgi:hypothetical protein